MQPGRCNRDLRAEAWRALEELHEEGNNTRKYKFVTYKLLVDLLTSVVANVYIFFFLDTVITSTCEITRLQINIFTIHNEYSILFIF